MILLKILNLSLLNLEIINRRPYKILEKYTLIIPFFLYGISSILQLPMIIYDYSDCEYRSLFISLNTAYFLVQFSAIFFLIIFFFFVVFITLILCGYQFSSKFNLYFRKISREIVFGILILLNLLFVVISITQIFHTFMPLIFFCNYFYINIFIIGVIIFYLKKHSIDRYFFVKEKIDSNI